jgi:hypothetical protein
MGGLLWGGEGVGRKNGPNGCWGHDRIKWPCRSVFYQKIM